MNFVFKIVELAPNLGPPGLQNSGFVNLPPTLDHLSYKILASSGEWLAGDTAIR
jgi:hypothetical protein